MQHRTPLAGTRQGRPRRRLLVGFALALAIAFNVFLLLSASRAGSAWFASLWFLGLMPALLCAMICYIGDPDRTRAASFYWLVSPAVCVAVVTGSALVLHEGVICLAMLSPIWLVAGWIGSFAMRAQRRRAGRSVESSLLVIPLVAAMVEAQVPIPHETVTLTRSVLVRAAPEDIWPYAVSSRDIRPDEGRWTLTNDVMGVPRPRASVMAGQGVGAVRTAYWGDHINFEERIVEWAPGRKLGWRFNFTNSSVQDYTDKHVSPDGIFLKVDSGDYRLRPVSTGVTELTLTTRYVAKTHVNPYAKLWGELMMGDVQDNILAIIKHRAERTAAGRA